MVFLLRYFRQIPGLVDSLCDPNSQVCSIYGPDTVTQVYDRIKKTKPGTAIFTFPNSPVKCPGAPQKIAYIAEDYFRKVYIYMYQLFGNLRKDEEKAYLSDNISA